MGVRTCCIYLGIHVSSKQANTIGTAGQWRVLFRLLSVTPTRLDQQGFLLKATGSQSQQHVQCSIVLLDSVTKYFSNFLVKHNNNFDTVLPPAPADGIRSGLHLYLFFCGQVGFTNVCRPFQQSWKYLLNDIYQILISS